MASRNTPKPKLLYLITKATWGGATKYVYELATSPLVRKHFDVSVAAGSDGELLDKVRQKGITAHHVPQVNSINPLRALIELYRLMRFLKRERPDMVHLNSSKMGFIGTVAARLSGIPHVVFTAHGWTFTENRRWYMKGLFRLLFMYIVASSSATIAVAQKVRDSLRAPRFIRRKIAVIYNGIEKAPYPTLPKLSQGSPTRHVVTVGELHPNKGQDTVLGIIPYTSDIHYHIIGDGEMRKKLERMIDDLEISDRVTLYGHIPAASLLSQYDVLLVPSRTEAHPFVVLEGLQAGLPIIARRVGGIPEVLSGLPSARLYSHDNELIELLKENIPNTENWNDQRFTVDTMVQKTMYEYQKALHKSDEE